LLLLAILLSAGCVQPQQAQPPARVEKYGFSISVPEGSGWFSWQDIPFGETLFQAMADDMGGEPMLVLIKPDENNSSGMSVIAVMLVDNNSGYTDVGQIPPETLRAGSIEGIGLSGEVKVGNIGTLNWIEMQAQQPATPAPFMSNIAVAICGKKAAAIILMNSTDGLEQNRAFFTGLAESAQCIPE
jgi:hypothetical protein